MSTVIARYRNISNYEYFNTARKVRAGVTQLATSPAIPKTHRFVFGIPMAQTARALVEHLVTANAFYPNSEHNAQMRKHYMTLAIADCELLLQDLQCLADMKIVKLSRCEALADDVDSAVRLIKGARKGVKVVNQR